VTFNKPILAGCLILSIVIGVEAFLARAVCAQNSPDTPSSRQAAKPAREPKVIDPLLQKLLDAAQRRFETQLPLYEEGRITVNRFIDALAKLEKARLLAATDEAERMKIRRRHVEILKEVEMREIAEVQVGRGSAGDRAEAQQRCRQAELDLQVAENDFDQFDARALKLVDVARERYEAQEVDYKKGRITIDRLADADLHLAEAELRTAKTPFERMAIKRRQFDRLKRIEEREEAEVKDGRGTKADLAEATSRRLEAEMDLHDTITFGSPPEIAPILRRLGELERKVAQLQTERDGRNRP
jgi:uncharacterized protein YnzC (UPF0291/DUF896 family)